MKFTINAGMVQSERTKHMKRWRWFFISTRSYWMPKNSSEILICDNEFEFCMMIIQIENFIYTFFLPSKNIPFLYIYAICYDDVNVNFILFLMSTYIHSSKRNISIFPFSKYFYVAYDRYLSHKLIARKSVSILYYFADRNHSIS